MARHIFLYEIPSGAIGRKMNGAPMYTPTPRGGANAAARGNNHACNNARSSLMLDFFVFSTGKYSFSLTKGA